jgi:hypothetical protein
MGKMRNNMIDKGNSMGNKGNNFLTFKNCTICLQDTIQF